MLIIEIQEAYYILFDDEARMRYDIQYSKLYINIEEEHKSADANTHNSSNKTYQSTDKTYENTEQKNYQFDDPILEKWILNARKQAVEFVKNIYKETKGITLSGCSYYFKALGICILIFIGILILISILRVFKS
jgi:curved DNA-binding protein CbpA